MEQLLPGQPSFPTRIAKRQAEYVLALRQADAIELAGRGDASLSDRLDAMVTLVGTAAVEALDAAEKAWTERNAALQAEIDRMEAEKARYEAENARLKVELERLRAAASTGGEGST